MKKIIALFLLVFLIASTFTVSANSVPSLIEMSDDECIAFVLSNDISIPQWYDTNQEWIPFIKHIIQLVENDPTVTFTFGHSDLLNFAYAIKDAVLQVLRHDSYEPHNNEINQ